MANYRFDELINQLSEIEKRLSGINIKANELDAVLKNAKGIKDISESTKKLSASNTELNKTSKEQATLLKKVEAEKRKQEAIDKRIQDSLNLEIQTKKSLLQLEQKEIKEQAKLNAEMQKYSQIENKSLQDLQRYNSILNKKIKGLNIESKEYKELQKEIGRVNALMLKEEALMGRHQRDVGNYGKAFQKVGALIKGAFVFTGISVGFSLLKNVMSGIINSTQTVGDKWAGIMGGMNFAYKKVLQTIATGDWSNFFKNIAKAYEDGKKYAELMDELFEKGNAASISESRKRQEIAELEQTSKDATKSLTERKEAALEIEKKENELLEEQLKLKQDEYQVSLFNLNSKTNLTEKEFVVFTEHYNKLAKLREKSIHYIDLENKAKEKAYDYRQVGDAMIKVEKENTQAIKNFEDYTKSLEDAGKAVETYAGIYRKYQTGSDEIIKDAVDKYKGLIDVETEHFTGTRRNEMTKNKILKDIEDEKNEKYQKYIEKLKSNLEAERGLFEAQQKYELSEYQKITQNEDRLTGFKEMQHKAELQFEIEHIDKLMALQKKHIKSEYTAGKELNELTRKTYENELEILDKYIKDAEKLYGAAKVSKTEDPIIAEMLKANENYNNTIKSAQIKTAKFNSYVKNLFKGEGSIFKRIFGTSEDADKWGESLEEAYSMTMSMLNEQISREIELKEAIVEASEAKIEAIKSEIEAENERINELRNIGAAYSEEKLKELQKNMLIETQLKEKAVLEEKKAKNKQKQLEIVEAGINIAGSVTKALNTPPPYNLILAAIIAGLGLKQLSMIKSAHYAKGTEYVELNGNKDGIDTVPAMLTKGEAVIRKDVNSKIPYDKGFKHEMIPLAAQMFLQKDKESLNVLKGIEKNTNQSELRNSSGHIIYRKRGNHIIYYR